jgi:hydroxyethylthiazole kinase-like uncharacterized protein yjeF
VYLVTAQEMRNLDEYAIDSLGIPDVVLMEQAGKGVAQEILENYPSSSTAVVLCGTGNNGGDGWVVARHLHFAGWQVKAWLVGKEERLTSAARTFYNVCSQLTSIDTYSSQQLSIFTKDLQSAEVIVDALLGTGTTGELRPLMQEVVNVVNQQHHASIVAVDLPTGVNADTGEVCSQAIKAERTVTFAYPKWGHFLRPGTDYCGEVKVVDIGLPPSVPPSLIPQAQLIQPSLWQEQMKPRDPWGHKGTYGHLLVIGGARGMLGAVAMSGKAAYRMGAGMVTLAVPEDQATALMAKVTQEMVWPWAGDHTFAVESAGLFTERASRFSAVAIGPGLGRFTDDQSWLKKLLQEIQVPLVLDADALNILAEDLTILAERSHPTVLTPHPGEMARLLGCSVAEVESSRQQVARELAMKSGATVVLKGRYTIIADPSGKQLLNTSGSPALAKAGSGDLLTGMMGSLIAQRIPLEQAVPMAVYYHGQAAQRASQITTPHSVCYSDLLHALGELDWT